MVRLWPNLRRSPDRALSVERYRRLAEGYDDSCRYVGEARRTALEALGLRPGQKVLDIACGTGAMLPALADRVSPGGQAIGIEHSPEMVGLARNRVTATGHVTVLESAVEDAVFPHAADALLFCYTHDVLQSPAALANVFAHARPGARVVVIGNRFQPWWWAAPINLWVCLRGWRYHTTYKGFRQPWRPLLGFCPDLRVERTFHLGMSYLAVGHFSAVK